MATPRTQIPELQFGVGYQPVASPALQAPVLRAPQVYQDDTVQALTEFANNFAQGFGRLKQVQTQQDIILGEQMFLDQQAEFKGLFDSASPSLDSEGKFVRAKQIAEETSLGARIGFDRAAGRMLAVREREAIEQAIQKAIVDGSAPDPVTGIPGNPSLFNADGAIAQARKEFRDSVGKSSSNWVLASPYAQEEYTNNMARLLPEAVSKGRSELLKVKQEKYREQLMEQTSGLISTELSAVYEGRQTVEQAYAKIGAFVRNNAVRGGISNPRLFLVDASLNAARSSIGEKYDSMTGVKMIDTQKAQFIYRAMGGYAMDGATLTGGEVGQKYYANGNSLNTELSSLNKAQDPSTREKLAIDSYRTGQLMVVVDKDNNLIGRDINGKPPEGGREVSLRLFLTEKQRTGGMDAVNTALSEWQGRLNPKTDGAVFADSSAVVKAIQSDFSVMPDSPADMANMNQMKQALIAGRFDEARESLGKIRGMSARNDANSLYDTYISKDTQRVLNDPVYKASSRHFENPEALVDGELNKLNIRELLSPADRQEVVDLAKLEQDRLLNNVRATASLPEAERVKLNTQLATEAVDRVRSAVNERTKSLRDLRGNIRHIQDGTHVVNGVTSDNPQASPRSAVTEITNAYRAGQISKDTYDKLITEDGKLSDWQTEIGRLDLTEQAKKTVRTAALTRSPKDPMAYLVPGTTGEGGPRELSQAGVEAAVNLENNVQTRLNNWVRSNIDRARGPGAAIILKQKANEFLLEEIRKDPNLNSKTAFFSNSRREEVAASKATRTNIIDSNVLTTKGAALNLDGQSYLPQDEALNAEDFAFARRQEATVGRTKERPSASPFKIDNYGMPLPESENLIDIPGIGYASTPRDFTVENLALMDKLSSDDRFRKIAPFQMSYTPAYGKTFDGSDPATRHQQGLVNGAKLPRDLYDAYNNYPSRAEFEKAEIDGKDFKPAYISAINWINAGNNRREEKEQKVIRGTMPITDKEQSLSSLRVHTGLTAEEWANASYLVKNKDGVEIGRVPITDWRLLNLTMSPVIPVDVLLDSAKATEAFRRIGITDPDTIAVTTETQLNLHSRNKFWGIK
jgi:hypothetical protein